MYRTNFFHTVLRKHPTTGLVEPLEGVQASDIRKILADGTEQSFDSAIYQNRTGVTAGNPSSDARGVINFWLDPGDYNIYLVDTTVTPKRLADSVVGVNSVSGAPGGLQLSQLAQIVQEMLMPSGTIVATGRSILPNVNGEIPWLICDGASYLRTDYPTLYAAIGTNYGSLSGTTFNVPDLRGRVPVGVDGAAGRISSDDDFIGRTGGEDIHTLITDELPATLFEFIAVTGFAPNVSEIGVDSSGSPEAFVPYDTSTPPINYFSTSWGSGQAHNNMPPYQIVNYMIKI